MMYHDIIKTCLYCLNPSGLTNRTEDMFQHLITPSTAINMVAFRVFGLFPGCVTLRGAYEVCYLTCPSYQAW